MIAPFVIGTFGTSSVPSKYFQKKTNYKISQIKK
jgi:hypothetical protein